MGNYRRQSEDVYLSYRVQRIFTLYCPLFPAAHLTQQNKYVCELCFRQKFIIEDLTESNNVK